MAIAAQAATHREEQYADHEDVVLDVARDLAPAGIRQVMRYWRACADDGRSGSEDVDAADHAVDDDGNDLDLTTTFGGVGHVDGRSDPVAIRILMDRLDAPEPPDPAQGTRPPRTLAQRRAAALLRLVSGERPPQITLDLIADHDTVAGRPPADPRKGRCDPVGSGPFPPTLLRTLACDAAIGRVLVRGGSEVLDLGRRTRLVTPALRRGLAVRDRTRVEPGCDVPAQWCDAHHVVPWQAHGPTVLTNLELRCRRHHLAATGDPRLPPAGGSEPGRSTTGHRGA